MQTDDAWLAVALALRYLPYGCRLFADVTLSDTSPPPLLLGDIATEFPLAMPRRAVASEGAAAVSNLRRAFRDAADT